MLTYDVVYIMDATAASPEPIANVAVMILLTLIPTSVDAILSSGTALIAFPSFVYLMNNVRRSIMTSPITSVRIVVAGIVTLPKETAGRSNIGGTFLGAEPKITSAPFSSTRLIPSAVISAVVEPCPLTGLYAIRSVRTPTHTQTIIAANTANHAGNPSFSMTGIT